MKKIILAVLAATVMAGAASAGELRFVNYSATNTWVEGYGLHSYFTGESNKKEANWQHTGQNVPSGTFVSFFSNQWELDATYNELFEQDAEYQLNKPNASQSNTVTVWPVWSGFGGTTFTIPEGNVVHVVELHGIGIDTKYIEHDLDYSQKLAVTPARQQLIFTLGSQNP